MYKSLSEDKGPCSVNQEQESEDNKEDEEDANTSQVRFDTMGTFNSVDFLTPGGPSLFSVVALPAKMEKLVLKDLPKTIEALGISKKSFRVTIDTLNVGIELLQKTAVSENSNARSIHDTAKEALKRGAKTLDNVTKKMKRLDDDLERTISKLNAVMEKMQNANSKRDAAISEKKTALTNLATKAKSMKKTKKELADVKKELADAKKEVEGLQCKKGDSRSPRDNSLDCL